MMWCEIIVINAKYSDFILFLYYYFIFIQLVTQVVNLVILDFFLMYFL